MEKTKTSRAEEFKLFMAQLRKTNTTLGFYTDFKKCYDNVDLIAARLHALNFLIGKDDIREAVHTLWEENPKVFGVLDILIAVRTRDKKLAINREGEVQPIEYYFKTEAGVVEYLRETGLEGVLRSKQISNLVDYVFGIEVGLDTNARKNRSGHIMEATVASLLSKAGIDFRQEVYSHEFPTVHHVLGLDNKRFDFVVSTSQKTYLIEVNFYSSGGSKLNEVARSYTEIALKINGCKGYEYVWITDGIGWQSARGKLEEAFYSIPSVYNLTTIKEFIQMLQLEALSLSPNGL